MIKKTVPVSEMRPGMILLNNAIGKNGQIVVPRKTVLTRKYTQTLIDGGVETLVVLIPNFLATPDELEEAMPYENKLKKSGELKEFRREFLMIANHLSALFETLLLTPEADVDYEAVVNETIELGSKYGETLHVVELLSLSRDFDDAIYAHSIGVALIGRIIGIKEHYSQEQIHDIVLCGLMHDIGKIHIADELLYKEDCLSRNEYEELKSHTLKGYKMLKEAHFPEFVSQCALYHHERCDGSGYPSGLHNDKIPFCAKIIAIADVYDAMTSKRTYRKEICPFDVVQGFEKEGSQKFDSSPLLHFMRCMAESMIGAHVVLSDDSEGKIIMLNEQRLTRPIVKVGDEFIDLMKRKDLNITEIK